MSDNCAINYKLKKERKDRASLSETSVARREINTIANGDHGCSCNRQSAIGGGIMTRYVRRNVRTLRMLRSVRGEVQDLRSFDRMPQWLPRLISAPASLRLMIISRKSFLLLPPLLLVSIFSYSYTGASMRSLRIVSLRYKPTTLGPHYSSHLFSIPRPVSSSYEDIESSR